MLMIERMGFLLSTDKLKLVECCFILAVCIAWLLEMRKFAKELLKNWYIFIAICNCLPTKKNF